MPRNNERIEMLVKELLTELGEDTNREGIVRTPNRLAKSLKFLTSGYSVDMKKLINNAIFTQEVDSMIIIKDIELYSLCEHHLLPFYGRCHIGYLPNGKVIGASKLARIVDTYSRRLQIQEHLTEQISNAIKDAIGAAGVGVMIEARHLCMMMRGVQKQNSMLVTSSLLGSFRDHPATRQEFLSLIGKTQQ
ncbi:MAG: GTP cyclohydrolase I FolE [Candidatus Margulisiibacteriota bacterium]|nr:MAG: GTP cyclohydrolase I FolE [Candidatus Margulisbacteria bacterium GWD2_39_127]OGI02859.1 MAG: GTP cyclohydrolase I FolE [Candidatus Margulisbacteria bacterium GWF2_38_17]OGI09640.1 MAG: GTP cyclohydrolase I FolE [Candidatus Margulisbacteria bacterium GWE2_39_32]PZM83034.1 MAG: GTP cyclohydrolase I FolE [Candidatus Margulisiibacteriota bacterium]HAR62195.1 GTP cyclohydrolase I FolE [Candidatus Margulisiibacteriota bacterium]